VPLAADTRLQGSTLRGGLIRQNAFANDTVTCQLPATIRITVAGLCLTCRLSSFRYAVLLLLACCKAASVLARTPASSASTACQATLAVCI